MKIQFLKNIALTILFLPLFSWGQFGFEFNDSILVKRGGDSLDMAWAGGLNHPQFSVIDFDFDGFDDIFIFDRSANQIRILHNSDDGNGNRYYKFRSDLRFLFPEDIRYRAQMVDYNGDGKNDLWTYGIGGVKVYKNIGNATDGLQWEVASNLLMSQYTSNMANLFVTSIDIPAYVDVDDDGDIDILTQNIGGQRMEYHKNMSMETYGIPDSLIFELKNECWGKFMEGEFDNSVQLNATAGPCGNPNVSDPQMRHLRHAGTTILAIDLTDNGVKDLILGGVDASNLTALFNGGTQPNQDSPMTSFDDNYPSNSTPLDLEIFPASFYLDVDFDGVKDLVVSTNANGGSENTKGVWFYKNLGTDTNPNFQYVKDDLFKDEMIDNGRGAVPILVDIDNDSLSDLLVAANYNYKPYLSKESKIYYYRNTGTEEQPEFTFITDDWLNLSQAGYNLRIVPSFADLTGDGLEDMILGAENGRVHYYVRTGNGANDFQLEEANLQDADGNEINVMSYSTPELFDLNNDGLTDLIVGPRFGGIRYFENVGTNTSPSFQLVTDNLGGVELGTQVSPEAYAVPRFVRVNDTTHLFAGSRSGTIYYYTDIDGNIEDGDEFNLFSSNYANITTGSFAAPFIKQIRDNNAFDMLVGGELGGLWAYTADEFSEPVEDTLTSSEYYLEEGNWLLFPNPSETGIFQVKFDSNAPYDVYVSDLLGRQVLNNTSIQGNTQINLSQEHQGVFMVTLIDQQTGRKVVKKIIFGGK
jgi:hypothetical protein